MTANQNDVLMLREAILKHMIAQAVLGYASMELDDPQLFCVMWYEGNAFRQSREALMTFGQKYGYIPDFSK